MELWETAALTEYFYKDFPSRNSQSRPLRGKDKTKPNSQPEIPWDMSLWRRPACQTLWKPLDISSIIAPKVPDLSKALASLSDTTVRRSAIELEDMKP